VVAERLGSVFHPIDLDPRWVKKLATRNATSEMAAYVDHVLEQTRHILETQDVVNLHATPPLVEAITRHNNLVDLVNGKIRYLLLSGAHVDMDTLDLLRQIFPDTAIAMAFGSTMVLSQAATRTDGDAFIFDPRSPYVVFFVVDPETGAEVPVRRTRPSADESHQQGMFIPNNLERDTAIRMPGTRRPRRRFGQRGRPVAVFGGGARHRGCCTDG